MGPTYADNATETYNAMLSKGRFFAFWNNCTGCHKIEGGGGEQLQKLINTTFAGDANIAYFAPPYLKPVGARLQEEWLHNFLKGPTKVRPIVKFRMPTFGFSDAEIGTATNYFLGIHKQQLMLTQYQFQGDPNLLAAGKALYDKINCLSCHSAGAPTPDTKAPSFALSKGRLKPDWVEHWIARPDSIMPGTPMTAFWWTAGKPSTPAVEILGGDINMQIHAVHTYIQSLGNGGIPSPTPYATINGVDKYVMPNGDYRPVMTNATPASLANQPGMPLPKKEALKKAEKIGKPTASK
jgi:cytochrome c2